MLIYSYRVFFRLPILILIRLRTQLLQTEDYAVCLRTIHDFNEHLDELELIKAVSDFGLRSSEIADVVQRIKIGETAPPPPNTHSPSPVNDSFGISSNKW